MTHELPRQRQVAAGAALIFTGAATMFAMTHHPTIGSNEVGAALAEIARESSLNRLVHGAMIGFTLVYLWGWWCMSAALGKPTPTAAAGLIAASTGTAAMVGAALVSGFVVPDAAEAARESGQAEAAFPVILDVLFSTNQWLAKLGSLGYAAALFFWSACLVKREGLNRWIGGLGLLCGGAITLGVIFGVLRLTVSGMTLIAAALAVWSGLVGWQMLQGKLTPQSGD